MSIFVFTSCENNNEIVDPELQNETEESESITEALAKMSDNLDSSGNVSAESNPAGNMVFDFCFNFVYPLTLSYNNGTTVTVNDINGLINVVATSTDQLFVTGIDFPFNVETYDDSSNSIVVETIEDEDDFEDLLDDCDFDSDNDCECSEIYEPVCVEVIEPNGSVFTISYPNQCEAECDGFTQADFVDGCVDTDIFDFGFGCFEFNYPIQLILDDGSTVTVNDDAEFGNIFYNQYVLNFVFPFDVIILSDGSIETIEDFDDLDDIYEDCYDDDGTENPVGDCTDDAILEALIECNVYDFDFTGFSFEINFDLNNQTLTLTDENNSMIENGTWEITTNAQTGVGELVINIQNEPFDVWFFSGCDSDDDDDIEIISENGLAQDIDSECD